MTERTLVSKPSIFDTPLWLKYSSSRLSSPSSPSILVMRLDCNARIFRRLSVLRFYDGYVSWYRLNADPRVATSSFVILFLPSHSSSRLTRESRPSIF